VALRDDAAGLAKDATLTGGTQKAIARGGAKGTSTAADVTSTASGSNHQGMDVVLYDASGNLIDPRSIRALTASDVVTAQQGAANATPWNENISQWGGSATSLGQKTMAASVPVVLASDQGVVTVQGNQSAATTGSIINATSTVVMAVTSLNVVTVSLTGAAFAGVVFVFEGSPDNQTSWSQLQAARTDASVIENGSTTALGNANAPRSWDIPVGGLTHIRVRATAWTSGTATITMIGQVFAYDPCPTVGISGGAGSGPVTVDPTFKTLRVSGRPIEALGFYAIAGNTPTYAGLAALAPLFSMRWGTVTSNLAIILKVQVAVVTSVAATAAGITERQLVIARGFTASDTGGTAVTLTGNNAKRRTSMPTSLVTDMRFGGALTPGTRTLDANAIATVIGWSGLLSTGVVIGATSGSAVGAARSTEGGIGLVTLLDAINGQDHPIVLASNEGVIVRIGGVAEPAGATQQTFVNIVWAEVSAF
jgi:hypothetical protein